MKKCKILFSLLLFVLLIGAVFYASLTSQFEFGSFEIKFNEYIIVSRIDIAVYCLVVVFVALYVLQFFIKKIIFSPRLISKMIKQNSINNNIDVLKSYIFANHIQDDQSISMLKPKIDKIIDNELYQSVVKIDSYVKNNETEKALIALSDLERNQKTERYAFKKSIELSCLNQKDKNAIIIANKAIKIYPNSHLNNRSKAFKMLQL